MEDDGVAFSPDRIANLAWPIEHSVKPIPLIGADVNDSRYLPSVLIDSASRTSGIRFRRRYLSAANEAITRASSTLYMCIYIYTCVCVCILASDI